MDRKEVRGPGWSVVGVRGLEASVYSSCTVESTFSHRLAFLIKLFFGV